MDSICRKPGFSRISIPLHVEVREMGAASVVSLEELRRARLQAEGYQGLREPCDWWLEQGERGMKEKPVGPNQRAETAGRQASKTHRERRLK